MKKIIVLYMQNIQFQNKPYQQRAEDRMSLICGHRHRRRRTKWPFCHARHQPTRHEIDQPVDVRADTCYIEILDR